MGSFIKMKGYLEILAWASSGRKWLVMLLKKKKETFRSQAKENSCGGREIRGMVVDMLTLSCLYNETVTKVCRLRTSPKHNTCIHEKWYIDQLK